MVEAPAYLSGLTALLRPIGIWVPITTKIILGSGDFFMKYWYAFIIGLVAIGIASFATAKTKAGRLAIDTAMIKTPGVSSLVKKSNTAALLRSLSSLLASGVPLIRSLEITSGIVGIGILRRGCMRKGHKVQEI